jgi:hypothetical protein
MTESPASAKLTSSDQSLPLRDLTDLKRHVRTRFGTEHPFRIAVEALPDTVSRDEFLVHLRILLPLARLEGA